MRRTKVAQIYRKIGNLRATAIRNWRALSDISGIEVDDAPNVVEQVEL
jgi:hypothetical protein